ncbi:MAG: RagB/SusD family nutrient uptake outer membrane protein [Bacteroidota bacterium]
MKNSFIHKILVVVVFFLAITSCSKDFLEVAPVGKIPVENFYKTDADAFKGLIAAYDILQWTNARDWQSVYLAKTLPSDESTCGGSSSGDQPPLQELDKFNYGSSNPVIKGSYEGNYYGIYRCNLVISKVDPINDFRKQVIAEAKCLRAYYYSELVMMFGKVPLILSELAPSEYQQPQAEVTAIYAQIEKDLTEAIAVLPLKSALADADKFRVTKGTAQALLGKAFLYEKKWKESSDAFEAVIASNEYQLSSDFSTLFKIDQELGSESIFEVMFVNTKGYDWGTFGWGGNRNMENNITWQLCGPRGDYFVAGNSGMVGGWGFNYPTKSMYDAYEATDIRRAATLWSIPDLRALGGDWTGTDAYGFNGYFRVKYGTFSSETGAPVGELNYGTNLRLIRYADVLLMASEAYYRQNLESKALTELNKVRNRAGLANVAPTGTALFDAIVKERQTELAFEGVRFFDLVRWDLAAQVLGPLGFVTGKNELFPIPLDEVTNNSKIVQNPGY